MKKIQVVLSAAALALTFPLISHAEEEVEVPEDVIIVAGADSWGEQHKNLMKQLFAPSDWHFEAQQAPRFLFVDKKGRVALGIGGNIKGTLQYDFDGECPSNGSFIPMEIPVPRDPAQVSGFNGTLNNSLLYFRLVGHSDKIGDYSAYIETQFSGGESGNDFYLRQAWISWNYLRTGLYTATFNDDDAAPFTIDEQGPNGGSCSENVGIQWTPRFGKDDRWTIGIGVEVPQVSYTLDNYPVSEISQRVPDVPAFLQYSWDDRASRVRLSAILRNLTYRDDVLQKNKIVTGYGLGLSGNIASIPNTTIFYQGLFGKGIGQYINDFSGYGYDLLPAVNEAGKMEAPLTMGFFVGAQYDFCEKFFMSATYSQARLYQQQALGADAYRYGQYIAVNAVCQPLAGLQFGIEYDWGKRTDISRVSNHANRIMAMASYTF